MWFLLSIAHALAAAPGWSTAALLDADDRHVSLATAASGRPLVLVVMKHTACPVCRDELLRLRAVPSIAQSGAVVVGLAVDTAASDDPLRTSVLHDPTHQVVAELGLWRAPFTMPALVVFDHCGDERGRVVGRNPGMPQDRAAAALLQRVLDAPGRCGDLST